MGLRRRRRDASTSSGSNASEPPTRTALRNLSSSWFLISQGTGILAIVLWQLHYQFRGLRTIAIVVWAMAIVFYLTVLGLYILRALCFPKYFLSQLRNNNSEVACLASISVALFSIIQMLNLVLGPKASGWAMTVYVLWWINTVLAIFAILIIPYSFAILNPPGIENLLPNSQLPIVAALTCAAAGASIGSSEMLTTAQKIPVVVVSYLLVGTSIPLTLFLDGLFLGRLFNQTKEHGAEPKAGAQALAVAYQELILTGPWSQGSTALQSLGQVVLSGLFARFERGTFLTAQASPTVGYCSIFAGLLFWGHATFWWVFAILSIMHNLFLAKQGKKKTAFAFATWSTVFPFVSHIFPDDRMNLQRMYTDLSRAQGVYTRSTELLGEFLDSAAFRVWSAILIIIMTIVFLTCLLMTIKGCFTGALLGLEHGWRRRPNSAVASDKERPAP